MKGVFSRREGEVAEAMKPGSEQRQEAASPKGPQHYVWEVPGKPVVVHLDLDVVDRMVREVHRGFGLVPRRGVEMGGILIGTCEPSPNRPGGWVVTVSDFEGIPCSHSRGMAYHLSDDEIVRFRDVLDRWKRASGRQTYAVGYYRSHTREGFGLAVEDVDLFNQCFPEPGAVTMLVKPFATRASMGAIFIRESGHLRTDASYLEFPFRRSELGGALEDPVDFPLADAAEAPVIEAPPPHTDSGARRESSQRGHQLFGALLNNPPPTPEPAAEPAPSTPGVAFGIPGARKDPATGKRYKTGWVWIPLSFIFLLLGVVLGFQIAMSVRKSPLPAGDPYSLDLTVAEERGSLLVRWARNSLAIQGAARGTLIIEDDGNQKAVSLDADQLKNGSVDYRRASNNVRFRLEVAARERTTISESVIYQPPK